MGAGKVIPWELAEDALGLRGVLVLAAVVRHVMRSAQDQLDVLRVEMIDEIGKVRAARPKDELSGHVAEMQGKIASDQDGTAKDVIHPCASSA